MVFSFTTAYGPGSTPWSPTGGVPAQTTLSTVLIRVSTELDSLRCHAHLRLDWTAEGPAVCAGGHELDDFEFYQDGERDRNRKSVS